MPLYDYECLNCGKDFEAVMTVATREEAFHVNCGGKGKQVITRSTSASGIIVFRGGFYRDIGLHGAHVNNPQELRNALDRNGSRSTYLENSTFRTSAGPDPIGRRGADPDTRNDLNDY